MLKTLLIVAYASGPPIKTRVDEAMSTIQGL